MTLEEYKALKAKEDKMRALRAQMDAEIAETQRANEELAKTNPTIAAALRAEQKAIPQGYCMRD